LQIPRVVAPLPLPDPEIVANSGKLQYRNPKQASRRIFKSPEWKQVYLFDRREEFYMDGWMEGVGTQSRLFCGIRICRL